MLIDFHSHILPKADHGSDSISCSLNHVACAKAAGVEIIVATPHFYQDMPSIDDFLSLRGASFQSLTNEVQNSPKIVKAAEVALFPGIENLQDLPKLCIENTSYILLEMPNGIWNDWVFKSIYMIEAQCGLRPIIAHIDRYNIPAQQKIMEMNLVSQVNVEAFSKRKNGKYYRQLFAMGKAHVIGSDAHGDASEYREFSKAVKTLGDFAGAASENAIRILNNEVLI